MALQHLRSSTADKRPTPGAMSDGQLALNTNLASPGLFFKDSNGDSVKIGPVHVGTTAPNVTPGAGGQAGNSKGEAWLDTTAANPILKVFNGSAFVAVQPVGTGTVVSTTDTGTVTSTMILDGTILNADVNASAAIAGTKISPDFGSQTVTTTGVISSALGAAATPSITFTGDLNTGIYSPGADQVAVSTGGVERINIEADGDINIDGGGVYYDATNNRLAIGSTAPVEKLIVADSGSANVYIALQNSTTGTTSTDGWYLGAAGTEFQIYGKENGPITFSLNSSEKARIDTSGSLLVGTSSLLLSSGIICSYFDGSVANGMQIHDTRTTSGTDIAIIFTRNTTNSVGSITTTTTSTAFNTSSDYRLKENVSAVTDGITRLQQLNPSRFNFIADPSRTVDGFIAHEVQTIVPEAITGEKDAVDADGNPVYQSIDQSKLVPLLTAALQEAIGRIETLEAEVAALKAS
jgi:hypothetical protein